MRSQWEQSSHQRNPPPSVHAYPNFIPLNLTAFHNAPPLFCLPLVRKAASSRSAHLHKERERQKLHQPPRTAWADAEPSWCKGPHSHCWRWNSRSQTQAASTAQLGQHVASLGQKLETEGVEGRSETGDRLPRQWASLSSTRRGEREEESFLPRWSRLMMLPGRRAEMSQQELVLKELSRLFVAPWVWIVYNRRKVKTQRSPGDAKD